MYGPTLQILIQELWVWAKHVYFSMLPGQFCCRTRSGDHWIKPILVVVGEGLTLSYNSIPVEEFEWTEMELCHDN